MLTAYVRNWLENLTQDEQRYLDPYLRFCKRANLAELEEINLENPDEERLLRFKKAVDRFFEKHEYRELLGKLYGLWGYQKLTVDEISITYNKRDGTLGCGEDWIRRVERKALGDFRLLRVKVKSDVEQFRRAKARIGTP